MRQKEIEAEESVLGPTRSKNASKKGGRKKSEDEFDLDVMAFLSNCSLPYSFVETKGAVVPWLGSQPRSLPRAQDLSVLGCKPLTPRVDLFWSQGRSFGCTAATACHACK